MIWMSEVYNPSLEACVSVFRGLHSGQAGEEATLLNGGENCGVCTRHIQCFHKPPLMVENRVSIFTAYIVGGKILFLFDVWGTALSFV